MAKSGVAELPTQPHTRLPATDPTALFRRRDGLYASDLLVTAIGWLDFFNWLEKHPADQETLCAGLAIAERPADVMLTLFTAMGLIRQQDRRFFLTDLAREHLTTSSPWDMGPYFASLRDRPICQDILQVLRTGDPFGWASKRDEAEWAKAMEREDFAAAFTAAMDSRGASLAPAMADVLDCAGSHRLLDIAGGSGIYACAVTAANPHLTAAVLEKPPVDKTARLAIARQDQTEQVSVFAADMFLDPLPPGFDIHLYSHVLHDWGTMEVKTLLRKSFDALVPGGIVVCHDAHLHPDKSGPLAVAEYSVLLMLSTHGKCYAVSEISQMLQDIGFGGHTLLPTAANRSLIIAQKPA